MTSAPFNDGWTFRRADELDSESVTLPHDAMIRETRSPNGSTSHHGGFFPGGRYVYGKTWVPESTTPGVSTRLRFEGVCGATVVHLNGVEVGRNDSGYREFSVDLDPVLSPGTPNQLEVAVDNSATPNSRWYTGSGIYRRVWLESLPAIRVADDGIRIHTRSLESDAVVEVEILTVAAGTDAVAFVEVLDGQTLVSGASTVLSDDRGVVELTIPDARAWSHADPYLYTVSVRLEQSGQVLDAHTTRAGLRTITIDATRGLRVNGRSIKLQGAAVHHDNGLLGAATFRAAEFRRARILKANGFNAIRSAHQPISRDLLDAADEVGLYVVDELADTWHEPKTTHDASAQFDTSWRDDARAMVAKARNHPSVIMYSIGNEVGETATPAGVETTKELSSFFHELDPRTPTTLAISFLVNVMSSRGTNLFKAIDSADAPAERKRSAASSTMANIVMNRFGTIMQTVGKLPIADRVTRDAIAEVDVAGYNYAWGRYRADLKKHPSRVFYGSETLPGDIAKAWRRVEESPAIIGDFLWSGWDYIGETGLGTWTYGDDDVLLSKAYPHILAGCGVIDILGVPGAPALLSRAVWGDLPAPGIAVRPLDHAGERTHRVAWRGTDAIQSWAWNGSDGKSAAIEVYSAEDEVALFLNGQSLGRRRAGKGRGFVARFRTPYRPGTIDAVAYRDGTEVSRSTLRSATEPRLRLTAESAAITADEQGLAFVAIQIADDAGVVEMLEDDDVRVTVSGAGELAGLGSASPTTTQSYADASTRTYHGRALAVSGPTARPAQSPSPPKAQRMAPPASRSMR